PGAAEDALATEPDVAELAVGAAVVAELPAVDGAVVVAAVDVVVAAAFVVVLELLLSLPHATRLNSTVADANVEAIRTERLVCRFIDPPRDRELIRAARSAAS